MCIDKEVMEVTLKPDSNSLMVNYHPQKFLGILMILAPSQYVRVTRCESLADYHTLLG